MHRIDNKLDSTVTDGMTNHDQHTHSSLNLKHTQYPALKQMQLLKSREYKVGESAAVLTALQLLMLLFNGHYPREPGSAGSSGVTAH